MLLSAMYHFWGCHDLSSTPPSLCMRSSTSIFYCRSKLGRSSAVTTIFRHIYPIPPTRNPIYPKSKEITPGTTTNTPTLTPFQSIHHGLVRRFRVATHTSSSCSLTRRRLHSARSHRPRTVLGWPRQLLQVPGSPQHYRQRAGRQEGEGGLRAGVEGV